LEVKNIHFIGNKGQEKGGFPAYYSFIGGQPSSPGPFLSPKAGEKGEKDITFAVVLPGCGQNNGLNFFFSPPFLFKEGRAGEGQVFMLAPMPLLGEDYRPFFGGKMPPKNGR
jgi:hypothetical protein